MPGYLLALTVFILLPMAEIYVLIQVGQVIGALWTVALLLAVAALGTALLRHQGLATIDTVQAALARGELPANAIIDCLVLLVAGVLMVTPGFLTDVAGFLCLLPPLRRALARALALSLSLRVAGSGPRASTAERVLEGDFRVEQDGR